MSRPYRNDPEWLEAQARFTEEHDGEDPNVALTRRIQAAVDLFHIEERYEREGRR